MSIYIGCDHAGVDCKEAIKKFLADKKHNVIDLGTNSNDPVDYPDFAHKVSMEIVLNNGLGILICGSGNGVAMTANKHKGVRAALCWNKEIASLARKHNNANLLCIPVRFVDLNTAIEITQSFLDSVFEKGRHEKRVDKIDNC